MDIHLKRILLGILFGGILIIVIFVVIFMRNKCEPHCSGIYCKGEKAGNGCGGVCGCNKYGVCQDNGICCYPKCNGLSCGSDGCGGVCQKCDRLPNGSCTNNKQCDGCPDGQCLVNGICQDDPSCCPPGQCKTLNGLCVESKICCYAQDCNNIYCGSNGCGDTCQCQTGSSCSNPNGSGVCYNSGQTGWIYSVFDTNNVERKNVDNAESCSKWQPNNIQNNLSKFSCNVDSDCPYLQKCISVGDQKFCQPNNVFQYWYYDPTDSSGFNCTKILSGSTVCGVEKQGGSGFDVIGNVGPSDSQCGISCDIKPQCPLSGNDSCCPQDWSTQGTSSNCIDNTGKIQCCLNNPTLSDYNNCIQSGYPDCASLTNIWLKGNLAEITSKCDKNVIRDSSITKQTLDSANFSTPCQNLNEGDKCLGDGYTGLCINCSGTLKCFPEKTCINRGSSSGPNGYCSSGKFC
jgi:hypothetical protein